MRGVCTNLIRTWRALSQAQECGLHLMGQPWDPLKLDDGVAHEDGKSVSRLGGSPGGGDEESRRKAER